MCPWFPMVRVTLTKKKKKIHSLFECNKLKNRYIKKYKESKPQLKQNAWREKYSQLGLRLYTRPYIFKVSCMTCSSYRCMKRLCVPFGWAWSGIIDTCASPPSCGTVCIWRSSTSGTCSCSGPPPPPPPCGNHDRSTSARSRRWLWRSCCRIGLPCPLYQAFWGHARKSLGSGPGRPDLRRCAAWIVSFGAPGLWWCPLCAAPLLWHRRISPL